MEKEENFKKKEEKSEENEKQTCRAKTETASCGRSEFFHGFQRRTSGCGSRDGNAEKNRGGDTGHRRRAEGSSCTGCSTLSGRRL